MALSTHDTLYIQQRPLSAESQLLEIIFWYNGVGGKGTGGVQRTPQPSGAAEQTPQPSRRGA